MVRKKKLKIESGYNYMGDDYGSIACWQPLTLMTLFYWTSFPDQTVPPLLCTLIPHKAKGGVVFQSQFYFIIGRMKRELPGRKVTGVICQALKK